MTRADAARMAGCGAAIVRVVWHRVKMHEAKILAEFGRCRTLEWALAG